MGLLVEGTDYEVINAPGPVYNEIVIKTINTVDSSDTIVVDLTKYGISATGLMGVQGFEHTTENSVVVLADPATTVSSGSITLTLTAGSNVQYTFVIKGFAVPNLGAAV